MQPAFAAHLNEQLELADQLLAGREVMNEPQDLPGRYGRVVRAIDYVLQICGIGAVLGGGWAVWRHGFVGRVTQDLDVALPQERIDEFIRTASVAGFDALPLQPGRWPKLMHRETQIQVDIVPEGARPGTAAILAPTTIPHPDRMGAQPGRLRYMDLPSLLVLKLAAGRGRDDADVIELLLANPEKVTALREFAAGVHADYAVKFDALAKRAKEQIDT
jgi:hypothetical protein